MSTLKADIIEASTTNGNTTIRGNGTGTVAISDNTAITGTFTASGIQTLAAAIAGADNEVGRINLKDYGEVTNAIGYWWWYAGYRPHPWQQCGCYGGH